MVNEQVLRVNHDACLPPEGMVFNCEVNRMSIIINFRHSVRNDEGLRHVPLARQFTVQRPQGGDVVLRHCVHYA